MQSSQNDTKLFHQLIKRQRRNNHSIDEMIFKCDEYDDTDGILEVLSADFPVFIFLDRFYDFFF
jgi:hypothetical protein